ncbi:MAG: nuclease-related domain-containing protein [Planctomycetota bacterium]
MQLLAFRSKPTKRDPVGDDERPLPGPGTSLLNQLDDVLVRYSMAGGLAAGAGGLLAGGLVQWLFKSNFPLGLLMLLALGVFVAAVVVAGRALVRMRVLTLGYRGERYVAESLVPLIRAGGYVFHDVPGHENPKEKPGRRWNIDHVVVGEKGVYAIESKYWRKWADRPNLSTIGFANNTLSFNGKPVGPDYQSAVEQAQRNARSLGEILFKATQRRWEVRPVLALPGWYIESRPEPGETSLWVLNPKALPGWVSKQRARLSEADVAAVCQALTMRQRFHVVTEFPRDA